jgi:type III pantothenate kinase
VTVAIDIGNSAVKVAMVVDGQVGEVLRLPTASPPSASQLAARISGVTEAGASTQVVAVVSVVPHWTELVTAAVDALGLRLLTLDATRIGLTVALPHPERVGADRLLAAWTAVQEHGAPLVVVDLGTATTVDAVDASGAFVGGAIAPGPELSIRALATGTAQLPPVPVELPPNILGRDTVEAIQSGVVLGHVIVVSGLIRRAAAELSVAGGGRPRVVLTGGFAAASWAAAIEGVDVRDPNLLLRGLALHAEGQPVAVAPGVLT